MKKISPKLLAGLTAGWFATAGIGFAQNDAAPATPAAPPAADQATAPSTTAPPAGAAPQAGDQGAQSAPSPAPDQTAATTQAPEANSSASSGTAEQGVILNFRGVPVDTVLNYLSDAAGFVIMRDADTRSAGMVDLVSAQPVPKDQIVGLLNNVLAKNGLTAVQDGRTLDIMTTQAAVVNATTPVKVWAGTSASVPQDATVVTEVIPVHSLNPTQVVKDLFTLRPPDAEMNANEGGNAIIMTAKQSDIRRFTEIIEALDSSGNGDLEVFLLQYADSKSIAQELKDVFSPTDATANQNNPFQIFGGRGRGGNPFGGGGGAAAAEDNPKRAAIHVNAVSDDENNAVLVSAPEDIMPGISNIIVKLDIPQEDMVEIQTFRLRHADPTDIVNELSSLFPDPSTSGNQSNARGAVARFGGRGGFGGFGGFGGAAAGAGLSDRAKKQATVNAVADARTQSVIVTASKDTMVEIEKMIEDLDNDPARIQHVYVYHPMNADVLDMQQPLQDLFASTSSRSANTQQNALQQRAQQAAQQNTITTGTSALGGVGSGGGGGVGGGR